MVSSELDTELKSVSKKVDFRLSASISILTPLTPAKEVDIVMFI